MGDLARFLFHRRQYAPSKLVVKPGAFLPRDGKTSVFEIAGLPEPDIRGIGKDVGSASGREPRGRPSPDDTRKDQNKDVARRLAQKAVLVLHN